MDVYEVLIMTDVKRNEKGHFIGSGNKAGRPKNSGGNKHKASRSKLETLLMKYGPEAIQEIMKLGQAAIAKGDIGTAFKTFVWIGDKYFALTVQNDKLQLQELKDKQSQEEDNTDEGEQFTNVEISFPVFKAV